MTPTAASCTRASLPRKAPPRPSPPWHRWCAALGGFASCTPTAAATSTTKDAAAGPDAEQHGQVSQALRALGIRQILARSPQARGRSERAFGTIQGRLPQELRLNRITSYAEANRYLEEHFIADFNRRFTVAPAQKQSAFTQLPG